MTDQLALLFERTADDWCSGAQPPPLPQRFDVNVEKQSRRWTRGLRSARGLVPAVAAAAVVAVALAAALIAQRGSATTRPIEQVAGPVPVASLGATKFRSTDAGLPAAASFGTDPHIAACSAGQLEASLDLGEGQILVHVRNAGVCALAADLRVTLDGPVSVVNESQPDVPNPPVFNGRFLHSVGIALNAEWSGSCDSVPREGALVAADLTVPLTVTGSPAGCGSGAQVLRVGPAHLATGPGAIVPVDRARLVVSLRLPTEVSSGGEFEYQVIIANPTQSAVSLRPCPTFATSFNSAGAGFGGYGRIPCEQLPQQLNGREQVALLMTGTTQTAEPVRSDSRTTAELVWQIAGTEKATGSLEVVQRAPRILPPVPYLAPTGEATAKSSYRYPAGNGTFPVIIEGPATARVGETLHYKVVFTNPDGGPTVPLRPCPAWTELMAQAPKVTNRPKIVERTGALNCAQAPDHVAPGEQIVFEMERLIGPDTPPGAYQMYWQIHNGMTSAPFDVDVVS